MRQIQIYKTPPPQWILDAVKEKFSAKWEDGVIFTYGMIISNIEGIISEDTFKHECTHVAQQNAYGADAWWKRYLEDDTFRFEQELEAYRNQFDFAKLNCSSGQLLDILKHCAYTLSGPLYGNVVDYDKAVQLIQNV